MPRNIRINEKISYIENSANPLSADIGIIRDNGVTWLYDVGDGERSIDGLKESYNVVISHFHQDHIGNIGRIRVKDLYVSKETYRHILRGTVVSEELYIENLHIFPLPSSHAKGSLGLEVDREYAFVGDALYCKSKGNCCLYNAQLLKEEITVLKKLSAPYLLVSHFEGLIRRKKDVIAELEQIYQTRKQNEPEIKVM